MKITKSQLREIIREEISSIQNEGIISRTILSTIARLTDKSDYASAHIDAAEKMVKKHLKGNPDANKIFDKHRQIAWASKYDKLSDSEARKLVAKNMDDMSADIKAAAKK